MLPLFALLSGRLRWEHGPSECKMWALVWTGLHLLDHLLATEPPETAYHDRSVRRIQPARSRVVFE